MWLSVEKIVVGMIFSFVLRQLDKFKSSLDWVKLKADMDERIKKAIPIAWLTPAIQSLADIVLDDIQKVLSTPEDLKKISDLIAASKWDEALSALKDLLLKVWGSSPLPVHATAVQIVKS